MNTTEITDMRYRELPMKIFKGSCKDIEDIASVIRNEFKNFFRCTNADSFLRNIIYAFSGRINVVKSYSFQEIEDSGLVIRSSKDFCINVPPFSSPSQDNFFMAHDLGHYLLHFDKGDDRPRTPLHFSRYGSNPMEWQANRFAAALLMPAVDFKEALDLCHGDLVYVASMFGVPKSTAEAREKQLSTH